jgi:4-carboxymuconolactone decarboxylase
MFHRTLIVAFVLVFAVVPTAQQRRELQLRGDRFKPLTWETLTPAQKKMVESLLAGPRASLGGPFNVLLRSPEMGDRLQQVGEYLRFKSSVPKRLNEMAILMTAVAWSAQYEWHAHKPLALAAGLSPAVIDDLQAGRRPAQMQPDEAIVYDVSKEMRERHRVSDATFNKAIATFGEQGVVDLIVVMGYYDVISMILNLDRYPMPPGERLPFPEPTS